LQRIAGGAKGVQLYVESLSVTDIKILWSHKEFGQDWSRQYENWASPFGTVELLKHLHRAEGVSRPNADLLLKFMTESNNPDNRLLGLLPKETPVAHKTGTGGTREGLTSAINDVGIITLPDGTYIVIAVYIQDSKPDRAKPNETIARIAKAVFDKWSGLPAKESVRPVNFSERHALN
jgi:beta-lactamase class A